MKLSGLRELASCLACLAGLLLWSAPVAAQQGPSRYGQTLVRSYELPSELLDQYNDAVRSQPVGSSTALADIKGWTGSEFSPAVAGNPYTLVVKMLGTATVNDDMLARWQPYWSGAPGAMSGMGEPGARAGEQLQLVLASQPVNLEEGRLTSPGLRLNAARNIRIDRVRVEVWSGEGKTSWLDVVLDWWEVPATLLVWAALLLYLRHDRRKSAAAALAAEAGEPVEK